ncbi:unnamed protein product [Sphagnum balticum]
MRDLALVSLANVYHQLSLLNAALIAGGAALDLSPKFVVIHFTLANVYSAQVGKYCPHMPINIFQGRLDLATEFYLSTLALQTNFEPARERIRAVYCAAGGRLPDNVRDLIVTDTDQTNPL